MWRHIVNIYDAERQGCDLFDIDELIAETVLKSLQTCTCVSSSMTGRVFSIKPYQPCMVDSWELWAKDFKPLAIRPFGSKQVWVGYDPAESGDSAGLVVVAPPEPTYNKFRLLEHHQFKGMDFASQALLSRKFAKNIG